VGPIIDTLELATWDQTSALGSESPVNKLNEWRCIRGQKVAMIEANGGNDPDDAAFNALSEQERALCQSILAAKPRTMADAAAMLDLIVEDSGLLNPADDPAVAAQKAVADYLRGLKR